MSDTLSRLKARHKHSVSNRRAVEGLLDDCYRFALPGRARFGHHGDHRAEDIYDETAVVGLEDFASIMHARLTPDGAQWVQPIAARTIADQDRQAVNADLEEVNDVVFEYIHASNFGAEIHEAFLDLGCSTGLMTTRWQDGRIINTAVPLTQVHLDAGAEDEVGALFRERHKVRLDSLLDTYPAAALTREMDMLIAREPDALVGVVDGIWRDPSAGGVRRGVLVKAGGGQRRESLIVDTLEKGYGALPFVAPRMSKAAGEIWGRGPVMRAMAGIKTTNLVIELLLQNAALSMVGIYGIEDDGQVNLDTIRIEPGTVVPHAPGSKGLHRLDMRGGDVNMAQLILEDQRRNIKRALYGDALADPNRTPATALEVSYRTRDLAERISASFNRLRHELLAPYWRRVAWLLERAGIVELPVPIADIMLVPSGPLARVMMQSHVQNVLELHQIFTAILGPQIALSRWNLPELEEHLRVHMGVPMKLIATEDERQQTLAQAQSAMQAMGEGGMP